MSLPDSNCYACGEHMDAATGIGEADTPTPGALSICLYCGAIAVYADDLTLREPTQAERDEALAMPMVRRAQAAIRMLRDRA